MDSRLTKLIAIAGVTFLGACLGACSSSSMSGGFVSSGGASGTATGGRIGSGGGSSSSGGSIGSGGGDTASGGAGVAGSSAASGGAGGQPAGTGGSAQVGRPGVGGGTAGLAGVLASDGCGKAPPAAMGTVGSGTTLYGKFTIPVLGQTVIQFNANTPPQMVTRQYFVRLPDNYDNTKPYRVIYQGPGCSPTQDSQPTNLKGQAPFASNPNSTAARSNAILVQMEQGTYNPAAYNTQPGAMCTIADRSGCNASSQYCFDDWASEAGTPIVSGIPDGRNGAVAMERAYFGALHTAIEANYCVDKSRQFYSGYSSGGWLAQQLGCWFPDVLRAQANVTGGIPPAIRTNAMGANDYCVKHPIAYFSIHNNPDSSNAFQGSVDGARRVFALNGCTGAFPGGADGPPQPGAATIPPGLEVFQITDPMGRVLVTNNSTFRCYHFTTCPAAYPMYFCVSNIQAFHDPQGASAAPAFWEFFSRL
jgi:hypothetical protein